MILSLAGSGPVRNLARPARGRVAVALLTLGGAAGCSHGPQQGAPAPQPPDTALEHWALRAAAPPANALQATFTWRLQEKEARFGGQGVTRMAPPDHARLDLFGAHGEPYLAAAVVGDDLRVPSGVDEQDVPPVALLWTVLGVLRPPEGARLVATRGDTSHLELGYQGESGEWRFVLDRGRLVSARWQPDDGGRHTVDLTLSTESTLPGEARYRDWLAFRELDLKLDDVKYVTGFSSEIWSPRSR